MNNASSIAKKISELCLINFPDIEEMHHSRGEKYKLTNVYQIRFKPKDRNTCLTKLLDKIFNFIHSQNYLSVLNIKINNTAYTSSKYSSISFLINDIMFEIVIALGANKGELFEKDLLKSLNDYVNNSIADEYAIKAFNALRKCNNPIHIEHIHTISARKGTTRRSGDISPEESGKIISDIIIQLKNGESKYVSVKNKNGKTVAQFSCAEAFNKDLTINSKSSQWKNIVAPLGLCEQLLMHSLVCAKQKISNSNEIKILNSQASDSLILLIKKMWGSNYYYLRELNNNFTVEFIDDYYLDKILYNLIISEIRYPSVNRKQVTMFLQSDSKKMKLELRNPNGTGEIRPTQVQLILR